MRITWTCPGSRQAGRTRSPVRRSAAAGPTRGPERAWSSRRRHTARVASAPGIEPLGAFPRWAVPGSAVSSVRAMASG
jgi:hypothetical protein